MDDVTIDEIHKRLEKYKLSLLHHCERSTKNITWTIDLRTKKWDAQFIVRGMYLDYHSIIYSQSLCLDKMVTDKEYLSKMLPKFEDYIVNMTVRNLARELFFNYRTKSD